MIMESFITTIGEFLQMDRGNGKTPNFASDKSNYIIPKYQREYKWNEERVRTLISDIKNRDKFLGNVIINKVENYYELVDGQQRITTIILILVALFNRNQDSQSQMLTEEQKTLLLYLKKNDKIILENESIGTYIETNGNKISIEIKEENDIYFQEETFSKLYEIIEETINGTDSPYRIEDTDLIEFQKKVLDCQVLVLIGEPDGKQQDSIEEVFLDINFKSQLLDVANIFKGYCFKKYNPVSHDELKTQWANIRSCTKQFENRFGYEENRETCEYLYLYLLSIPGSYKIPANLSPGGTHYLEEKNHTQTKKLLEDMVAYGNNIIRFHKNLSDNNYHFQDVCFDSPAHKNEISRIQSLRSMALVIVESKDGQYYKLPFFMLIHYLLKNDDLSNVLDFTMLKSLITNIYIYAFLFISSGKVKNKSLIAHSVISIIQSNDQDKMKSILAEIKSIRKKFLDEFEVFRTFNPRKVYAFYSIIDHYISNANFLEQVYSPQSGYTPEHFLIHDNKLMEVRWRDGEREITFSLKELLGKPDGKNYKGTTYKKQIINYLILPKTLNERIEHDDVVSKIHAIKQHYSGPEKIVPAHISLYIEHITKMQQYIDLANLKGKNKSQEDIEEAYKIFINSYFGDDNQGILYRELESTFKKTFQN